MHHQITKGVFFYAYPERPYLLFCYNIIVYALMQCTTWRPFVTPSREPTPSIVVIWVKKCQTEFMPEIHSKSTVRAIGKVLLVKFS